MYGWLEIRGDLKSTSGETPFHVYVEVLAVVPDKIVVDYLRHYLDAGTQEECENHPMLGSLENWARAALTYRYLRPKMRMLVNDRTDLLTTGPSSLGAELFSDDLIAVWGVPPSAT